MAVIIRRDNDPFKKYWWVLLLGFSGVTAWVCRPLLKDRPALAAGERSFAGASSSAGGLDSAGNPTGAPGSALSMPGAYAKQSGGSSASSLYQSPAPVDSSPKTPAAAPATFADALKAASKKSDPLGWGGEKARKGYVAPKLAGKVSGMGAVGRGGGGGGGSVSPFGTARSKPGFSAAQGFGFSGSGGSLGTPALNALGSGLSAGGPKKADLTTDASQGAGLFDGNTRAAKDAAAKESSDNALAQLESAAPGNLKEGELGGLKDKLIEGKAKADEKMKKAEEQKKKADEQDKSDAKADEMDTWLKLMGMVMNILGGGGMNGGAGAVF